MYTDPLMQRNIIVPHFADGRVRYHALDPYRKMLYLNSFKCSAMGMGKSRFSHGYAISLTPPCAI